MKNITNWQKNKTNKIKYIIAVDPAGIGQTGIIIYNVLQNKIINNVTFNSKNKEEAINNIYLILNQFKNKICSYFFNFVENSWWNSKNNQYENLKRNLV